MDKSTHKKIEPNRYFTRCVICSKIDKIYDNVQDYEEYGDSMCTECALFLVRMQYFYDHGDR